MPQTDQRKLTPERRSEIARMGGIANGQQRNSRARFTEAQRNKIRSDNLAKGRAVRHTKPEPAPAVLPVPVTSAAMELYRFERAAFKARQEAVLAEAKAVFVAQIEAAKANRNAGRPKKPVVRRDPANALLDALESVHG